MFLAARAHGMFLVARAHGMFLAARAHGMFLAARAHGMFLAARAHGMFLAQRRNTRMFVLRNMVKYGSHKRHLTLSVSPFMTDVCCTWSARSKSRRSRQVLRRARSGFTETRGEVAHRSSRSIVHGVEVLFGTIVGARASVVTVH
ncbi:hypothetical protein LSAT2_007905 [Lamellibrachia satsuma]|nr:hypothetical protein LSAT2_007905 [Lamellibrachia satsuma]